MKRIWALFVAEFLLSNRKLIRGKNKYLVLHLMGLEWFGFIDRKDAHEWLRSE